MTEKVTEKAPDMEIIAKYHLQGNGRQKTRGDMESRQTYCWRLREVCWLPGAEAHQRDGRAREEDGDQEEGAPPPHVRQRSDQGGRHEGQQALQRTS